MFVEVQVSRLGDDRYCVELRDYYEKVLPQKPQIVLDFGDRMTGVQSSSGRPIGVREFEMLVREWRKKFLT